MFSSTIIVTMLLMCEDVRFGSELVAGLSVSGLSSNKTPSNNKEISPTNDKVLPSDTNSCIFL